MKSQFRTTFSERTEIAPTMFIISDELDGLRQITFSLQRLSKRIKFSIVQIKMNSHFGKQESTPGEMLIFAGRNRRVACVRMWNSKQKSSPATKCARFLKFFPECAARRGSLHEDDFRRITKNSIAFRHLESFAIGVGCLGHNRSRPFHTPPVQPARSCFGFQH